MRRSAWATLSVGTSTAKSARRAIEALEPSCHGDAEPMQHGEIQPLTAVGAGEGKLGVRLAAIGS